MKITDPSPLTTNSEMRRSCLGQYFTPANLSYSALKVIPKSEPNLVVDLAVGQGALLNQAKKLWSRVQVLGFDIDPSLVEDCGKRIGEKASFACLDTLSASLYEIKEAIREFTPTGQADVAVANPPFGLTSTDSISADLLETLEDYDLLRGSRANAMMVSMDVAFFVRNLQVVGDGGYLAIVLPESTLAGTKNQSFRNLLVNRVTLRSIHSFPMGSFKASEARTCCLVVEKRSPRRKGAGPTTVGIVPTTTHNEGAELINQEHLLSRMDPKYHLAMRSMEAGQSWEPLSSFVSTCHRGYGLYGTEKSIFETGSAFQYVHTVDIGRSGEIRSRQRPTLPREFGARHQSAVLRQGDVLVARVGRGCAGRAAIAHDLTPCGIASDCVLVVRSETLDPYYLTVFLNTQFAQTFLQACRRGICSQYITKQDFLSLPVYVPTDPYFVRLSAEARSSMVDMSSDNGRVTGRSAFHSLVAELDSRMLHETSSSRRNLAVNLSG